MTRCSPLCYFTLTAKHVLDWVNMIWFGKRSDGPRRLTMEV